MTDRIKLTEDDFTEFDLGGETYWQLDCTKERKQQILDDQEKAELYNHLYLHGASHKKLMEKLEQENKQLKEDIHLLLSDIKRLNPKMWKMLRLAEKSQQKLEKIKEYAESHSLGLNNFDVNKLKEILDSQESNH